MIRSKLLASNQPGILKKKSKKRSASISSNKENLSKSHNNSSFIAEKTVIEKNLKQGNVFEKQKKKKSSAKQKSALRLPSTQMLNNFINQQENKSLMHLNCKQPCSIENKKKIKKVKNQSTIFRELHQQFYGAIIPSTENQTNIQKNLNLISLHPEFSKSSTILTHSSGNIRFSEQSQQDVHEYNCQLRQDQLLLFKKQALTKPSSYFNQLKEQLRLINQQLVQNKAAVIIQKIWRGYLTRKLLNQYIESLEPIYEEQLKQIRTGRQSRQQVNSTMSVFKKDHEKNLFFEDNQLQQCSQIEFFQQNRIGLGQKSNTQYIDLSKFSFSLDKSTENISKMNQTAQRNKLLIKKQKQQKVNEIPIQFLKKTVQLCPKKQDIENPLTSKNKKQLSISPKRKNATKLNSETLNKISQFSVKGYILTPQNSSGMQDGLSDKVNIQSHYKKSKELQLNSKTVYSTINPLPLKVNSQFLLKKLEVSCKELSTLFTKFNILCIEDLKSEIKQDKLVIKELIQRKDALKEIVQNGYDFVQNVEDQIAKAFNQMRRIIKEGSSQRHLSNNSQQSDILDTERSPQSNNCPNQKFISSECMNHRNSSAGLHELRSSSQKQKNYKLFTDYYQTVGKVTSQLYTIELPTEEYSTKGKSPIQENYDEQEESYNDENDKYQNESSSCEDGQAGNDYGSISQSSRKIPISPKYSTHQQSLQILNQFLLNLIEDYEQQIQNKKTSELEYLCQTLKRVSCDSQNKTIIDRCLIEFIVEIMSETWTLKQIYQGFKKVLQIGIEQKDQDKQQICKQTLKFQNQKLYRMIRKWIEELYKWEMSIIQEVSSKMQSSSFINTENFSLNQLRQAVNSLPKI